MKILTIIGNRPQFVKAAAVSGPLRERHDEVLVHTGQHHDDELSAVFVRELGVPAPDRELGVAGGPNTAHTTPVMDAPEARLAALAPGLLLLSRGTNPAPAGAPPAPPPGPPRAPHATGE